VNILLVALAVLALFLSGATILSAQKATIALGEGFDVAVYPKNIHVYVVPADVNQIVFFGVHPNMDKTWLIDRILYLECINVVVQVIIFCFTIEHDLIPI